VASLSLWLGFSLIILAILAFEFWQTARRPHPFSLKEAAAWSGVWVAFSILFGIFIWKHLGTAAGWEFFAAYLVEKSLSLDNLFVFLLVFRYFAVEPKFQPRILEYGVVGALVIRLGLILAGTALLAHFHWMTEVFGAFLIYAAFTFVRGHGSKDQPEANRVLGWIRRIIPITREFHGEKFFIRKEGALHATPLLLALLSVEFADVVFAMDSIPAALSITQHPFVIFSSNACAILGLRALYFLLAGLLPRLRYLERGLAALLVFLGAKMLAARWIKISIPFSLSIICGILLLTILFSLSGKKRTGAAA
jgi:tellurite resistance protein TerC